MISQKPWKKWVNRNFCFNFHGKQVMQKTIDFRNFHLNGCLRLWTKSDFWKILVHTYMLQSLMLSMNDTVPILKVLLLVRDPSSVFELRCMFNSLTDSNFWPWLATSSFQFWWMYEFFFEIQILKSINSIMKSII